MYTNLPYIYEGEVVAVQASPFAKQKNVVRYTVSVIMTNGSNILVSNVIETSMFGGIDDYFQQRARTSEDGGNNFEPSSVAAVNKARIGQRCYVAFVGGSISAPIIVAWKQHPNQTLEFDTPENLDPQAVLKYLGMRFDFKDDGSFKITHFGLPEIKFVDGKTLPSLPIPEVSLPSFDEAPNPIKPDKANVAVVPADASSRTFVEFKKDGGFQIRDSLSQVIHIDTEEKRILIANNETDGPEPKKTEFLSLDRSDQLAYLSARKMIQIESLGDREDKTEKDYTHTISGNEFIKIKGDKEDTIEGGYIVTVTKDYEETVKGTYTVDVKGAAEYTYGDALDIIAKGEVTIKSAKKILAKADAGGTLSIDGAKVALGASGTEVLKTLSDTIQGLIDTLTAIQALTVPTALGPSGPPINIADFIKVMTTLNALKGKLDAITGSI